MTELRRRIGEDALSFQFTTSGGPGGQNVNKVNTRAVLSFDLAGTDALSPEERRRILARLGGRVTRDGMLRVSSMRFRTQRANRSAAVDRFFELLAQSLHRPKTRVPTRVSRASVARRLTAKRQASEKKSLRRRPSTGGNGS